MLPAHFFSLAGLLCLATFLTMTMETVSGSEPPAPGSATRATNTLGAKIFGAADEGNICISPYSIAAALAMTYAGSAGETREQMSAALGFPTEPTDLSGSFAALDEELLPAQEGATVLSRANRLFGQTGFSFRPPFLEIVRTDFDAPLEELDFAANPGAATDTINSWVEEQTREKIRDLIPPGALNQDTTLVLVNALYFLAQWSNPFPEAATSPQSFHLSEDSVKEVPTMTQTSIMGYQAGTGFEAVALSYAGGEFQLVILLPEEGLVGLEQLLNAEFFEEFRQLPTREVTLHLPKFRLAPPTMELRPILVDLGMPSAFDQPRGSADFDAMAPRRGDEYLYISDVFHKTFFDLDEKGTEAAAATAVVMMRTSLQLPDQPEPIEIRVDRPFLFFLQHTPTGACLFLGRVMDPSSSDS